jgi:predicted ArsR family transcriptional regulator
MLDTCCLRLADLLCQGGQSSPRSLAKLVEKTGLARSTVLLHLKHLETNSLLAKEEILQGKAGRPKMLYKPASKLLERVKTKSD